MLLHLLVMISITCIHSFERYTWPESVVSIWMVGIDPMIWTSKEGDDVMDNEDTAESRTRDVFLHPTTNFFFFFLVSYNMYWGCSIRTHGYSVDFARDLDYRVDATKDMDSVVELSVLDFNRFVVLLVFL